MAKLLRGMKIRSSVLDTTIKKALSRAALSDIDPIDV